MKATFEVDVLKLYAGKIKNLEDTIAWNRMLTYALERSDLDGLVNLRYGIQVGMAAAQRKGLVTEPLAEMFCRWTGSIEKTMRQIVKKRMHLANDQVNNPHSTSKTLQDKRARDVELERFLRKKSY
jgi:hypothetical protein